MITSIIAAMDRNRGIGYQNSIPWIVNNKNTIPEDMKRFRELTLHHAVIMGRNTYLSMGKALPNRTNIVLTSAPEFTLPDAIVASSLQVALDECEALAEFSMCKEVFIIGGGKLFAEALPNADRMYLTEIDTDEYPADTYFPHYDEDEWQIASDERFPADAHNAHNLRFLLLEH